MYQRHRKEVLESKIQYLDIVIRKQSSR